MNKGKLTIVFVLLTLLALSWGCSGSGNGGSGVLPEAQLPTQEMKDASGHWGTYQVSIDLNTHDVEITQLRQSNLILNVLGFMEPPALVNMSIDFDTLVIDIDNNYIGVDVSLSHPIPDPVFMGFDVRGICIGPELTNADGYTILMNPADFESVPFGYIDGLLGAPNSYANYDGIWGYKYFCNGLDLDDDFATFFTDEDNLTDRGVFSENTTNWRHYDLSWDGSSLDFMVFNYAVYANYDWPLGDPPIEIDMFPISTANSQEAFCASAWAPVANTMYWDVDGDEGGGMLTLDVEVWDWQDASVQLVTIESVEAGVIAQTASDADSAGSTSKSWIHTFTDVPAVPTTIGDLDILITITSPDVTFGEAWFFELMDSGHDFYDENLWCTFMTSAYVALYEPATGGWSIKDTDVLPTTIPVTNEKNFCVQANDGFDKEGIYYFTGDVGFDVSYYDMTYSGPSTLAGSLFDPFFGNIGGILINVADLGSIEVPPMGAVVFCNRSTAPMVWGGYLANAPVWWCSPTDFPSLTNGWLYFNMRFIDLEYPNVGMAENMWGFWVNNPAGVDGATYYLTPSYSTGYFSITGYFTVDHSSAGVDGQISVNNVKRFGIDTDVNPDHLAAPCSMMWYYLEQDPGNPSVEVCGNASTFAFFTPKYTIDDDELDGLPVDLAVLSNWTDEWEDVEFNQMALLEDYEDGTWTVSWWEWDGTAMQLIQRLDPIDGTPHNLDIDNVNNEVHVWATDGGTTSFWIFYYN